MISVSKNQHSSLVNIIRYGGTYIGAVIGAGYATGQEVLQFFVGYGYKGIIGVILAGLLFCVFGVLFMELGHKLQVSNHKPVLTYLCGNFVGKLFDLIIVFFLFGVYTIMIAGGGAALNQYFGINLFVGKTIITAAVLVTLLLGFSSALTALGITSQLIIGVTLTVSCIVIFSDFSGIRSANEVLKHIDVAQATPFWWSSAVIYVSYCTIPTIPVLIAIGNTESNMDVIIKSGIFGGVALGAGILCLMLALLSKLKHIYYLQIPFLEIANHIHPIIGIILVVIILAAVYTTAVPMLYGISARYTKEGTHRFRLFTILLAIAAFILSIFPFNVLVGTVYPLMGYIGLVVMFSAIYKVLLKKDQSFIVVANRSHKTEG